MTVSPDNWQAGDAYEGYMGRWSRRLARAFVGWLESRPGADWLEVGCGTGALTAAVCELAGPRSILACDPSPAFVAYARGALRDDRVSFVVAGADDLPAASFAFDCVTSALVLNFLPSPDLSVGFMKQRLRRGGALSACVWDYASGIEFLRAFWDEATALDAAAAGLDERRRFPICEPLVLAALLAGAGLSDVSVEGLEITTDFRDFDDYWTPFLRGTGPAPSYVSSLPTDGRERLRERLASRLQPEKDRAIRLTARAWAVCGVSS